MLKILSYRKKVLYLHLLKGKEKTTLNSSTWPSKDR